MSLKTVCDQVLDTIGIDKPASYVGNTSDDTAVRIVALANKSGRLLAKRDWTDLIVEHTFTTTASASSYSLPSDYDRHIDSTLWDRSNYWRIRGPRSPQEWQVFKSGIVTDGPRKNFRIKGGAFHVHQIPTATETLVYEYITSQWCSNATADTFATSFQADTDVTRFSEDLLEIDLEWRLRESLGFAYAEAKMEAEREIDRAFARDGGARILDMGQFRGLELTAHTPESGFG